MVMYSDIDNPGTQKGDVEAQANRNGVGTCFARTLIQDIGAFLARSGRFFDGMPRCLDLKLPLPAIRCKQWQDRVVSFFGLGSHRGDDPIEESG